MSGMELIRKIEELSINAIPALQTAFVDGWILRFSDGYSRRANAIHPIYPSMEDLAKKIRVSEKLYRNKGLYVIFKIIPTVTNDLDDLLEQGGYRLEGRVSLQTLPLNTIKKPNNVYLDKYNSFDECWFFHYAKFKSMEEQEQAIEKEMLQNIMFDCCFLLLKDEQNNVLACGLGVLQEEYIGLFNIVTDERLRGRGYGEELMHQLLHWGKENGAKKAYLQVAKTNKVALNLYKKLGFQEEYEYWYRVKR